MNITAQKRQLKAINEALSILKLAGYTLNRACYTMLVNEKAQLEKEIGQAIQIDPSLTN